MCLLLVFASGTNLLYTLVWSVSKADRNAWPRWAQPKSLLTVQNEPSTIRLSGLPEASTPGHPEARHLGRLTDGGASWEESGACPKPKSSHLLLWEKILTWWGRQRAEKLPKKGDPGLVCLGFKIRWPILSFGHFK